ncbi:MAG: HAD family hydrolase [Candidatus Bipolaricaulota bacterium]|nr:HAD family hydrolase [Candidatus Bipolaricaulota bacterium]MBS3793131.1 HAD family hydrolase [Candidatus Bipolaricaulota bacterium]
MVTIKSLTTLIFDLDGTLCRYKTDLEEGLLETFDAEKPENLPLTTEDYQEGFGVEFDKAIDGEVDQPEIEFRTRVFWNVLQDQNYSKGEILELGEKFARIREDSLTLYPDVPELFKRLSGKFKLGLLTNGPSNLQRRKIETLGIENWFEAIIVSGEHGLAKPDPRIFYIAMDELECGPEETIYVGNSLKYDVLGAKNAGVPVVWKKNGKEDTEVEGARPSMVIDELKELLEDERDLTISEGEKRSIKS